MERYRDPVGWIERILFLIIFCYGIWAHHLVLIILGGFGVALGWIPLPRERWANEFTEGVITWWDDLVYYIRIGWVVVGSALFVVLLLALWTHNLTLAIASGLTIVIMKLIALRKIIFK